MDVFKIRSTQEITKRMSEILMFWEELLANAPDNRVGVPTHQDFSSLDNLIVNIRRELAQQSNNLARQAEVLAENRVMTPTGKRANQELSIRAEQLSQEIVDSLAF